MYQVAVDVQYFFSIVTMPIGILLNFFTIWIFSRKRFNKNTNNGFLYIILCLSNIIALLSQLIINIFEEFAKDPRNFNLYFCHFYNLFSAVALQTPSFAQIYISYDLYRSICKFKKKPLRKKNYIFFMVINILFLLAINSIYFTFFIKNNNFLNETSVNLNSTITNYSLSECMGTELTDLIADGIDVFLRGLIPFTIIFIINYSVTKQVFKTKNNIQQVKSLKKEYNFAITVIAINIVFLFIYLPWIISFVLYHKIQIIDSRSDIRLYELILTISDCIAYLNNYSPFLINILFNNIFREELILLPTNCLKFNSNQH